MYIRMVLSVYNIFIEYFSKFWGPFEEIFATLDDLSSSVTEAIHQTADHYDKKTFIEQFATRFLLKEVSIYKMVSVYM